MSIAPAHSEAIAQRMVNAENGFIECVCNAIACEAPEARKVLAIYRRLRIVKLDAGIGRYTVAHGIYWEPDSLRNALAMAGAQETPA